MLFDTCIVECSVLNAGFVHPQSNCANLHESRLFILCIYNTQCNFMPYSFISTTFKRPNTLNMAVCQGNRAQFLADFSVSVSVGTPLSGDIFLILLIIIPNSVLFDRRFQIEDTFARKMRIKLIRKMSDGNCGEGRQLRVLQ
jgi:hypothetical protein